MVVVGPFSVCSLERAIRFEGETPEGMTSVGRARLYEVTGATDLRLTVRDTTWSNGERDVVACERHESPERFDTLVERLRLPVLDRGGRYVELRQARLRSNGRAGLFNADLVTLDRGAGVSVEAVLLANGALQVATREELLGDGGRTRLRMGARFGPAESVVPLVAYVLTRVCPVEAGLAE